MKDLPRCWPILFLLEELDEIQGHFYLQKYIYLAKVEGKVPINYAFVKDEYGPYSISIKSDAFILHEKGLIEMFNDSGRWIFKLTDKGKLVTEKILENIPKSNIQSFKGILAKFKNYSLYQLKNHVYNNHIRSEDENNMLKNQIYVYIKELMHYFDKVEVNKNSVFILGSLDYCLMVLENEDINDSIKKDLLLAQIYSYCTKIKDLSDLIYNKPEILIYLDIKDYEELFDYLQDIVSQELEIMPRLDDENFNIELFVTDDEDQKLNDEEDENLEFFIEEANEETSRTNTNTIRC